MKDRPISLRTAIFLSVVIHVMAAVSVFFLLPQEKKRVSAPFFTRLVSPEELRALTPKGPAVSSPRLSRPAVPPAVSKPVPQQSERPPIKEEPAHAPSPAPPAGTDRPAPETARPPEPAVPPVASVPGAPGDARGPSSPQMPKTGGIKTPPTAKERLFDREIVEKFAKREEEQKDNSVTFDTGEFRYHTYMVRLKEKIEGIWKYPPEAARRGVSGDLYIRFTIRKNGSLGEIELLRTSGYRSLDEAAQQALREAQPFWPLPEDWGKDNLTVTGHFIYSIYGTYIR